jgi:membrane fusion protein, multidrug efflux system
VKQEQGTVLADQGSVDAAQVNVRYCRITSPVDGRVGVRLIDPGNIVTTGTTTGIIIVNQIQPIAVTFTVPQGDFQRLVSASAGFSRPLTTQAASQETGADLGSGELVVADNHVDQTTGTVEMKARFPNPTKQLWPGQFVNVNLTLQTLSKATVVPAAAVNQGPKGAFAYLVGADNKVTAQPVSVLTTAGAVAVIQSGLVPGQTVVVDGQMSLKAGASVCTTGHCSAPGGKGGKGGGSSGAQPSS